MHLLRRLAPSVLALALGVPGAFAQTPFTAGAVPPDHDYLLAHPAELPETKANSATLDTIFKALFAKDWEAVNRLYSDRYVQHNPDMKDGREGVIELFSSLNYETLVYEPVLRIAEGPYVAVLSRLQFAPDQPVMAVVDINFIRAGQSREHWDIIAPTTGKPNAAGRTPFEIVLTDTPLVSQEEVNRNKALVADFINIVLNGRQIERVHDFIGEPYYQHGQGGDGAGEVIRDVSDRFVGAEVDIKRIIGQNDLVLAHTRVTLPGGKAFARVDIWRARGGRLVEHWGVMQPVPAEMKHPNGMF